MDLCQYHPEVQAESVVVRRIARCCWHVTLIRAAADSGGAGTTFGKDRPTGCAKARLSLVRVRNRPQHDLPRSGLYHNMTIKPNQLSSSCASLGRASARPSCSTLRRPLARPSLPPHVRPRLTLNLCLASSPHAPLHRPFSSGASHRSNPASDTSPPSAGPTAAYDEQVRQGIIQNDDHQRGIVAVLQGMYDQLERYSPPEVRPPPPPPPPGRLKALSDWLFPGYDTQPLGFESPVHKSALSLPPGIPPGLYLYGSVGCGKSYLMDLFYANLPAKYDGNKRRIHFHAFMVDIHQRGHRFKMNTANKGGEQDWIMHAAADLAKEARVLCFDEFQVSTG